MNESKSLVLTQQRQKAGVGTKRTRVELLKRKRREVGGAYNEEQAGVLFELATAADQRVAAPELRNTVAGADPNFRVAAPGP